MSAGVTVEIKYLPHAQGKPLSYQTDGAAGFDIPAALPAPLSLDPGQWTAVPAGFQIALPEGYEAQVRPRSGLAAKHGVTVLNSPGTIDADYRGEVKVLLINHGRETFIIEPGMRIAQMAIAPVIRAALTAVDTLSETTRGFGGFGHTGT